MTDAKVWMAKMISNDFDIEDLIRSIQKDAKEDYSTDLCEFAEWCSLNGWFYSSFTKEWGNSGGVKKTTSQLREQFEVEIGREHKPKITNDISNQVEIVKQRLYYHFLMTDGTWNLPADMPFMKEFLNEVKRLCEIVSSTFISETGRRKRNETE